jgi:hypothetical protein
MNIKLSSGALYRAASSWRPFGFFTALSGIAGCLRDRDCKLALYNVPCAVRTAIGSSATAVLFTLLMIVFVLAPMLFAFARC